MWSPACGDIILIITVLPAFNLLTKFEVRSISRSKDIEGSHNFISTSRDPGHAKWLSAIFEGEERYIQVWAVVRSRAPFHKH